MDDPLAKPYSAGPMAMPNNTKNTDDGTSTTAASRSPAVRSSRSSMSSLLSAACLLMRGSNAVAIDTVAMPCGRMNSR